MFFKVNWEGWEDPTLEPASNFLQRFSSPQIQYGIDKGVRMDILRNWLVGGCKSEAGGGRSRWDHPGHGPGEALPLSVGELVSGARVEAWVRQRLASLLDRSEPLRRRPLRPRRLQPRCPSSNPTTSAPALWCPLLPLSASGPHCPPLQRFPPPSAQKQPPHPPQRQPQPSPALHVYPSAQYLPVQFPYQRAQYDHIQQDHIRPGRRRQRPPERFQPYPLQEGSLFQYGHGEDPYYEHDPPSRNPSPQWSQRLPQYPHPGEHPSPQRQAAAQYLLSMLLRLP